MPPGVQVLSYFLPGRLERVAFVFMVGYGCKIAMPSPADMCMTGRTRGQGVSSLVSLLKAFVGTPLGKFGLILLFIPGSLGDPHLALEGV